MSSFKPIDPKRDEIRRYLERGNVLEPLTKLFIRVIQERPENPMEYIQNNIGVVRYQHEKYERLQTDLHKANVEIERLRQIIYSINPAALDNGISTSQEEQPCYSGGQGNVIVAQAIAAQEEKQQQHFVEAQTGTENYSLPPPPQLHAEQNSVEGLAKAIEECHIEDAQQQIPSEQLEQPKTSNENNE